MFPAKSRGQALTINGPLKQNLFALLVIAIGMEQQMISAMTLQENAFCKDGYKSSATCHKCDHAWFGYPQCKTCNCSTDGSWRQDCSPKTGQCPCRHNFDGQTCDECKNGHFNYPDCSSCGCYQRGITGEKLR